MIGDNEPSPIVRAFGGATVGHQCPTCDRIHPSGPPYDPADTRTPTEISRQYAEECCGSRRCDKHNVDLGKSSWCPACSKERDAEKEAKRFAEAKKVSLTEYCGQHLFREGFGREGFFDVDAVEGLLESGECPAWAFGCTIVTVSEEACDLSDHVSEGILSDHHEDAADWIDAEKVKQASKLIFEACADVKTYEPDYSIVVLLRGST